LAGALDDGAAADVVSVGAALVVWSAALSLESPRLPHAVSARAESPATNAMRAVFLTASS
jgi:hypothetical protein